MKKILYIDIDGVLANIAKSYNAYKEKYPEQPYPQSQYGFFMEMEPITHAIESVEFLAQYFDVWFLTAPSFKNPMCYTEKAYWIKKHFGEAMLEKLIICSNKSLCHGDYLIDDHNYGRGQDKFTGELIHFGTNKFPNWKVVSEYLLPTISTVRPDAIYIGRSETHNNAPIFQFGVDMWIEINNDELIPIKQ